MSYVLIVYNIVYVIERKWKQMIGQKGLAIKKYNKRIQETQKKHKSLKLNKRKKNPT